MALVPKVDQGLVLALRGVDVVSYDDNWHPSAGTMEDGQKGGEGRSLNFAVRRSSPACIDHAPITGSFAFQMHRGEVQSQQSPVPPSAPRLFLAAGIGVVVELRAHIDRRLVRKGIPFQ